MRAFTTDIDPNNLYRGQTWERFAKGQTLVGVDESDTDFASAGKTGGAKTHTLTIEQIPSHEGHLYSNGDNSSLGYGNYAGYLNNSVLTSYGGSGRGWNLHTSDEILPAGQNLGGSGAHNNLQPYITVYYWKRAA